jgi:hypothetical protein
MLKQLLCFRGTIIGKVQREAEIGENELHSSRKNEKERKELSGGVGF